MEIEFSSRGGQFPYQAEGYINNKYFFYFRARHNHCSLELYKNKIDMDHFKDSLSSITISHNSCLTDIEAEVLIKSLYKSLKYNKWIK